MKPAPVNPRDVAALRWVGEQYACRMDHLAVLLGWLSGREPLSGSAARAVANRWVEAGLADRGRLLSGEAPWVWPTRAGLRLAGLAYQPWQPKAWMLAHTAAINRVRLFVEPRRPGARWRPERELRRGARAEPVPDAELLDAGGNVIAIEVELSPKSSARRRQVMLDLVAHYEAIWYFAAADCWSAVHDAACHVPPQLSDLVRIYSLEDC